MIWVIGGAVFLLGLATGSFLNAFIYRLEVKEGLVRSPSSHKARTSSVVRGRSFCPSCGHTLAWHDLIPLLSFAFLRGRCRYCKEKISLQYPFVELATALLFTTVLWFILPKLSLVFPTLVSLSFLEIGELLYLWVIASLLMVIFVYDLKHYLIPDRVLMPAIGITLVYQLSVWIIGNWALIRNWELEIRNFEPLFSVLIAGVVASAFFLAIFLFSRGRAMGFGDVKLALFMGLFLGWPGILVALAFAFTTGALVGIGLLLAKKKTMRSEVPFGPFLVLGAFVALFWGKPLVDFYMNFIL